MRAHGKPKGTPKRPAEKPGLPAPGKVRKPRPNSKEAILRIFARLVADKGYGEASISNIADELGLSKGTVAFHFGSKEALFRLLVESYMDRRIAEAQFVCSRLSTVTEQLCGMIYALLALYRDDRDSTNSFLREFVRFRDRTGNERLRERRNQYFEIVHQIVRQGMDAGEFRKDDSRMVTFQIFGMCNYAWTWLRADGPRTIEEIATIYCSLVIAGLRNPSVNPPVQEPTKETMATVIEVVNAAPNRVL